MNNVTQLRLMPEEKGGDPRNLRGVNAARTVTDIRVMRGDIDPPAYANEYDEFDCALRQEEYRDPITGLRLLFGIVIGFWALVAVIVL
jgi:hypothetical protein